MEKLFEVEGICKELAIFLFWGKENVSGYKTKTVNEEEVVVEICCKVCAKHKNKLSSVKGAAMQSLKAFTCGMNNVTKHQVSVQFIYFRLDIIL